MNRDIKAEIGLSFMEMESPFSQGDSKGRPAHRRTSQSQNLFRIACMTHPLIYFDNAATTFPKAPGALARMVETFERIGVSPGRGSYDLAVEAEDLVFDARKRLARPIRCAGSQPGHICEQRDGRAQSLHSRAAGTG
jgi:hypothetical protein